MWAMSHTLPIRPSMFMRFCISADALPIDAWIGLAIMPGSTAFTRMLSRP